MNFEKIVKEVFDKNSIYGEILSNILGPTQKHLRGPILSEVGLSFCDKNKRKVVKMYNDNTLKYHFTAIVKNQLMSTTSPLYRNERQTISGKFGTSDFVVDLHIDESDDEIERKKKYEELLSEVDEARNRVESSWFESEIFKMYFDEGMSYREIQRESGVNFNTAFVTVHKMLDKLKQEI